MKLYYSPGLSSLSPHIVAREAGFELQLIKVDLATHITFSVVNWCHRVRIDVPPYPHLVRYLRRIADRPKVEEALKAEGLESTIPPVAAPKSLVTDPCHAPG